MKTLNNFSVVFISIAVIISLNNNLVLGASLYMAPGSSTGGNGSISNPFHTLVSSLAPAKPGDTVYLRGGTYRIPLSSGLQGEYINAVSGIASAPITIQNYPN